MSRFRRAVFFLALSAPALPAWSVPAGTVEFVLGTVQIRNAGGALRPAARGTVVEVGETVIAAANGNAQMRMIDNAFLAVRPDTELEITDYRYSGKADGSENALLRLVRGTMRAFTGQISSVRRDRFVTRTATSTIGIRGSGNVAHYSPALGTINHTLEGSHVTSSVGAQGQVIGTPVVTNPGQTVQVQLNQPPVRVPTPPFILQAATGAPKPAPAPAPAPGQTTSESSSESSGRASSASDAVMTTEALPPAVTSPATTAAEQLSSTTNLTGASSAGTLDVSAGTLVNSAGTVIPLVPGGVIPGAPTLVPSGKDVIVTYFYQSGPNLFSTNTDFGGFDDVVSFSGPNGNFNAAISIDGQGHTITVGGDVSGASTVSSNPANGISFGRYGGQSLAGGGPVLQVSGQDHQAAFAARNVIGNFHWISGPVMVPFFANEVLTGSATYALVTASAPFDQNNVAGALNSAALAFNFDNQSVSTALDITMPGSRHWVASATGVALGQGGHFFASSTTGGTYSHRQLSVLLNGGAAFGNLSGQLTGPLLNGAILAYNFTGFNPLTSLQEWVNGVAGFGNPVFSTPPSATPSFALKLTSLGSQPGFDVNNGLTAGVPAASVNSDWLSAVTLGVQEASRLRFNGAGQLMEFDEYLPVVSNISGLVCSPSPCFQNEVPMRVSINPFGAPAVGNIPPMPAIAGTAATVLDFGSDPLTGIQWGRYTNDQFAVVDRVNGSPVGTGNAALGPINHFLLSATQAGPTTLPTTGSATYTFVGGTNPTDSTGAIGTLNSATLAANFSAKSVSTSVALTVGTNSWTASAANLPIIAGTGFHAQTNPGGTGTLAVTCAGAGCNPAVVGGRIIGGFTGATGEGAGIAYTLNSGGLPTNLGGTGVTVGGVAAFRR